MMIEQAKIFTTGCLIAEILNSEFREGFEGKIKEMIPDFDMMEYCEWLRQTVCDERNS